jgi:hypothetical protein
MPDLTSEITRKVPVIVVFHTSETHLPVLLIALGREKEEAESVK